MSPQPKVSQWEKAKFRPNYQEPCHSCGAKPTVPATGLCGPCNFGDADASGGGWWDANTDNFSEDFIAERDQ